VLDVFGTQKRRQLRVGRSRRSSTPESGRPRPWVHDVASEVVGFCRLGRHAAFRNPHATWRVVRDLAVATQTRSLSIPVTPVDAGAVIVGTWRLNSVSTPDFRLIHLALSCTMR